MGYTSLKGSTSAAQAISRSIAGGHSASSGQRWWDTYGAPAQESRRMSQSLVSGYQKREKGAREANLAREKEIRGIYGDIIGQYETGGAARTAGLADIEQTKTRAIGAGTQQMISSGMYGTTTAASIPVQAENQASLSRLKLEDMLQQRTTQAKLGLAGFAERIDTPYPDYSMLMQAMIAQGSK
jgi:hypothetical protein